MALCMIHARIFGASGTPGPYVCCALSYALRSGGLEARLQTGGPRSGFLRTPPHTAAHRVKLSNR